MTGYSLKTRRPLIVAAGLLLAVSVVAPAQAGELDDIIKQHAPSIVSVKYVMKLGLGGRGDEETESETYGVMVDPAGLVLCSNTQLGGFGGMMTRMLGNMPGFDLSMNISNVKVLIGDDDEELNAKVLARDPELDLAWIEITPSDRKYEAIDFSQAAEAALGDDVVAVRKLGKYFDRAAAVEEFTIGGQTQKPRKLLVPQSPLSTAMGMPVFTRDGKPVGVVIVQMPSGDDLGGRGNPMAMLGSLFSMQDSVGGMILPATEVVKATGRARAAGGKATDDTASAD